MTTTTLDRWHRVLSERNAGAIDALLADEVVFHSPVMHSPQVGRALTRMYLGAAMQVLANPSFRYVREVVGSHDAVLEFSCEVEGIAVNGVDMLRWDDAGLIIDFKVMVRPLKAINLLQQKMAAMLAAAGKG